MTCAWHGDWSVVDVYQKLLRYVERAQTGNQYSIIERHSRAYCRRRPLCVGPRGPVRPIGPYRGLASVGGRCERRVKLSPAVNYCESSDFSSDINKSTLQRYRGLYIMTRVGESNCEVRRHPQWFENCRIRVWTQQLEDHVSPQQA